MRVEERLGEGCEEGGWGARGRLVDDNIDALGCNDRQRNKGDGLSIQLVGFRKIFVLASALCFRQFHASKILTPFSIFPRSFFVLC